jgi:D-threonate/D-erythronate kinase
MTIVRLLADDLTGALDTSAEFVPLTGPLPVNWADGVAVDPAGSAGFDSGTRERDPGAATMAVSRLVGLLAGADIAFKKVDSLLRGPTLAEIAACMRAGSWRCCVFAPAFPYQGRTTRLGRHYARVGDDWTPVSDDLVGALQSYGMRAQLGDAGSLAQPGVTVFDAETDEDLRRVVASVQRWGDPVLWAGSGGLAHALTAGLAHPVPDRLAGPVLGLFGSDQKVTADQLAACEAHWLEIEDEVFDPVLGRLNAAGLALVSFRMPPETPRALAAGRIATAIGRLVDQVEPPGTVVVAGGETLRTLCDAVHADRLLVQGRLVPGVPCSVISGGRWDGVTVVSKSGAFGHKHLLRDLIVERTG